jgi:hypothetical protein
MEISTPVVACHDKLSQNDSICRIFDILSLLLGTGLYVHMFPRNNGMFSLKLVVYCPIFRLLTRYLALETHSVQHISHLTEFALNHSQAHVMLSYEWAMRCH